jgi:hypothetical protein
VPRHAKTKMQPRDWKSIAGMICGKCHARIASGSG